MQLRFCFPAALLALVVPAAIGPGATADPSDVAAVIQKFKDKDPGLAKVFADAHGYAVFPTVGKGGIGIGAARGKGHVYQRGRLIGRSTLTQVSIGLQLGGQAYSDVRGLGGRSEVFVQGHRKDLVVIHGVLFVSVPKAERAKPREIRVKATAGSTKLNGG